MLLILPLSPIIHRIILYDIYIYILLIRDTVSREVGEFAR